MGLPTRGSRHPHSPSQAPLGGQCLCDHGEVVAVPKSRVPTWSQGNAARGSRLVWCSRKLLGGRSPLPPCPSPSLGHLLQLHLSSTWVKTRATSPGDALGGIWWLRGSVWLGKRMCEQDRAPPARQLSAEAKQLTCTSDLPENCVLTLTAMHQEQQTLHHRSLSSHHQVLTPMVVEPALISGLWLPRITLSRGPKVPPGFTNTSAGRLPSLFCGRDGTCRGWLAELGMGLVEDPGALAPRAIRQGGLPRWHRSLWWRTQRGTWSSCFAGLC